MQARCAPWCMKNRMTCTVAIIDGHAVVMASDSASTSDEGELVVRRSGCKVWTARSGHGPVSAHDHHTPCDLIVGFSGVFTYGLWVRHAFNWPMRPAGMPSESWLVSRVQPALAAGIKARFGDKVGDDWTFLVGVREPGARARLFTLYSNGDVEEAAAPYAAIGLGAAPALGCLATLDATGSATPSWERLQQALDVAEMFHTSVRGPMHVDALI
jgi:hypothetical protein